jgi:hypothetical protein
MRECIKRGQSYFPGLTWKITLTPFYPYLLLLVVLTQTGCVFFGVHLSRPITGTIIDAKTKTPLAGVVVTASWSVSGWHVKYPIKVSEAVTNENGEYTLPGWGPRLHPDELRYDQPVVRFFKPGYVPFVRKNNSIYHPGFEGDKEHLIDKPVSTGVRHYEPEAHMVRFGKKKHTFMLEPFVGTDEEYIKLVKDKYVWSFGGITHGDKCEWKRLPITFSTLHKLSLKLGLPKNRGIYFVSYLGGQDRCGNAEEYFEEYLK